jgi:WD40 repeat protein
MPTSAAQTKPRHPITRIASVLLCMAVVSCGGGGGGGGGAEAPGGGAGGGGTPPGATVQAVINPGVGGKLFMRAPFSNIEFDLATGVSRVLRARDGSFRPSLDGQEFALTNSNPADLSPSDDREEMVFFGRDGRSSSRFLVSSGFSGTPLLSPDKTMVLVEWHSIDEGDAGGVPVPTVFMRDGRIVKRFVNYDNEYAWLPNGDILLSRGDSFFRASLTSTAPPQLIRSLPGQSPRAPTLSPDGTKLAFTIGNFALLSNTTWMMNIDGSGLREVARATGSSLAPASFSPDGTRLLVAEGINYAAVGPGFFFAGCAKLYVLPLDATGVLNIDPDNASPPALKLRSVNDDSGDVDSSTCGFSTPAWRNLPDLPPAVAGTAAQGAGLNRGLSGNAWYGFAGDLFRSDLATGATAKVATITRNQPFVSLDGSEITVLDIFAPSDPSDEAALILNSSGQQISRVDIRGSLSAPLKLSPDKTRIAARYENLDAGDGGADTIVNVFSRDFSQVLVRWRGARSWAWLPDGRLLLASLNELAVSDASLQNLTTIARFTDPIGGITASRDGQRIAFNMNSNVWLINIDGSGLKQLSETSRPMGRPEFSPDGRFVLVDSRESPYVAWAIPADGERVHTLNPGVVNTSAFALRVIDNGAPNLLRPSSAVNWR